VYFWGDNYAYQVPTLLKKERELGKFHIAMFKAQGGNPNSDYKTKIGKYDVEELDSFYGYNSYGFWANGAVNCWLELITGQILFGGDFTKVFYSINGKAYTVPANHLAILNPDGRIIPVRNSDLRNSPKLYIAYNGVTGPGATVKCMIQTPDKSILIGGRFEKVLNRSSDCKNIWFIPSLNINGEVVGDNRDVDGGLTSPTPTKSKISPTIVKTMLYDRRRNVVYVGGYFSQSVSQTVAVRNIAAFTIDKARKWSSIGYGVNGAVNTLSFLTDDRVFVGGDFTAAYVDTGTANLLSQTARGAFANVNLLSTPGKVFQAITMPAYASSVTTLPTLNALFDGSVKTSITTNNGNIILGGNFTYITYNAITLDPTSFVNRYAYPRITMLNGFKTFTPMESGVANNNALAIEFAGDTTINHICKSPYSDDVYAVGKFNQIGSLTECICIARWTKNRWEAVDFELEINEAYSVFISKLGYGFVSVRTSTTTAGNRNKLVEPAPIVIENVGLNTQFCLELTNPITNYGVAKILSLYNITTDKSMTLNMSIAAGETIRLDFTRDNIHATSNIRDRVSNSLIGGGTLSGFFLNEGKNVIKILGGGRAGKGNRTYASRFARPVTAKIKYHVRQVTPYQLFESDTIEVNESLVSWQLGKSRLGLDTILAGNLRTEYPSYNWSTGAFRLDLAELGIDTVTIT
jgi:hypothetical protein